MKEVLLPRAQIHFAFGVFHLEYFSICKLDNVFEI